ncbi:SDR family oxidoreductase [Spirillospora sp. NPDC049652]
MVGTNLAGFFHLTRAAVPHMLARGSGHIVAVTSSLVDNADSRVPSVLTSLTKGGLQSAVKSLAIEFAARGVRANAVSPGVIDTPMHPPSRLDALAGLVPAGRLGAPGDIAGAVMYLETAPYVTGVVLPVDGGQSAGH